MNLRDVKTAQEKRELVEQSCNVRLSHIAQFSFDEEEASTKHCENMIGATQIPLGVAGPLSIQNSDSIVQSNYIPLATTEGALVASVNRGCKAITESGGTSVLVQRVGTTRGPVFYTKNVAMGQKLEQWINKNKELLQKSAQSTSNHLSLLDIHVKKLANYVFVKFNFDTQDAMGMNMVTIASENIAQLIEQETNVKCIALAGNFDIDKKPAWMNFSEGRGFSAWAEVIVPETIVQNTLKTTAQKIYDVWLAKNMLGSAMSGSLGFNAHFANIIAALFIATGQDPAHVVEGSLGMTTAEVRGLNLYFSVHLPSLMLGTVGGGTNLATQQEALNILDIAGGNNGKNAEKFAEITAGAVLAGELSLLASLSSHSLASAHKKLGRNKG